MSGAAKRWALVLLGAGASAVVIALVSVSSDVDARVAGTGGVGVGARCALGLMTAAALASLVLGRLLKQGLLTAIAVILGVGVLFLAKGYSGYVAYRAHVVAHQERAAGAPGVAEAGSDGGGSPGGF